MKVTRRIWIAVGFNQRDTKADSLPRISGAIHMMAPMLIEYNVSNCFSIVKILIRQLKQTAIHMMAPIILGLFLLLFYFSSKLSRKQTKRGWKLPAGYELPLVSTNGILKQTACPEYRGQFIWWLRSSWVYFCCFFISHRSFPENKLRENESYPQDMNCRWFQPTGY
jgi:hypothetical protein